MQKGKRTASSRRGKTAVLILAAVLLLGLVGGVSARYVRTTEGEGLFAAKNFYFTSNLLAEEAPSYTLNSTAESVTFTLSNGIDKLRYSDDDVDYTVEVEKVGGTPEKQPVVSSAAGSIENGAVNHVTITLSNLEKGARYTVTATGRAGYRQKLQAEFTVSDGSKNLYYHVDDTNSAYALMTVWSENVSGELSVSYDAQGLTPDSTDPILTSVHNYSDGVYNAFSFTDADSFTAAYSSREYRFFRSGTVSDKFTVKIGYHTAEKRTALD